MKLPLGLRQTLGAPLRARMIALQNRRPAFVWLLAGELAFGIVLIADLIVPARAYEQTLCLFFDCPPSVWIMLVICLALYSLVALALHVYIEFKG